MSSSFGRPQPRRVDAQFDPGQPNRLPGMNRQIISRTPDGRFQDFSNAAVAGDNAERGYKEAAAFIEQAGDTFSQVYRPWLQNEIDKELGEIASTPEALDGYLKGDSADQAWMRRFRPQTQALVDQSIAKAGAEVYQDVLFSKSGSDPVLISSTSTPEEIAEARQRNKAFAYDAAGLAAVNPQWLGGQIETLTRADQVVDGRLAIARDRDNKAIQDQKLAGGAGGRLAELAGITTEFQRTTTGDREQDLAQAREWDQGRVAKWQQQVTAIEDDAGNTSNQSALIIYRGGIQASTAALGSGTTKDTVTAIAIVDEMWYLANSDVRAGNGQLFGELVITKDGKTFKQLVAERRIELEATADKVEAERLAQTIAPDFQMLLDKDPRFAINYLWKASGGDIEKFNELSARVMPTVNAAQAPTDAERLAEARLRMQLSDDGLTRQQKINILENEQGNLTPLQFVQLSGLVATPAGREQLLQRNARTYTADAEAELVKKVKTAEGDNGVSGKLQRTPEQIKLDLRAEAQQRTEQQIAELRERDPNLAVDSDAYTLMYEKNLNDVADEQLKKLDAYEDKSQTKTEQLQTGLANITQRVRDRAQAGESVQEVEVFPDIWRERAVAAGRKDTYRGVLEYFIEQMADAKDEDGKKAFTDPSKNWFEIMQTIKKEDQTKTDIDPYDASIKSTDASAAGAINPLGRLLFEGLYNQGGEQKQGDQASSKPVNVVAKALDLIFSGRPAQAGTLEGKPQIDNQDRIAQLSEVVAGRRPISLQTPSLPQAASNAPAEVVPAQISTDTHPYFLAIGIAEGTRTPDGGYTRNYYGHSDPGNGARNVGTVSSQQYGSPDVADRVWAGRLSALATRMTPVLFQMGLKPGTVAFNRLMFNRLDLEVQSPAAAADLFRNLTGDYSIEGIAKARADSFINPATGQLEAGGFGGSYNRLFTDQRSRAGAFDYKRRF